MYIYRVDKYKYKLGLFLFILVNFIYCSTPSDVLLPAFAIFSKLITAFQRFCIIAINCKRMQENAFSGDLFFTMVHACLPLGRANFWLNFLRNEPFREQSDQYISHESTPERSNGSNYLNVSSTQ